MFGSKKMMMGIFICFALMVCHRANAAEFKYPTREDVLNECKQAISEDDNVAFFNSLCGIRIFNTLQSLSMSYQSIPMKGDETKENSIICHYQFDNHDSAHLQEFAVASQVVDYLLTLKKEDLSRPYRYVMAEVVKAQFAPPCNYQQHPKKIIYKNENTKKKPQAINKQLPTQKDFVLDCEDAVAKGDGTNFLFSKCAARINGVLGGYSLAVTSNKKLDVKLCVPQHYFSNSQSVEYQVAKDVIQFFSKNSLQRSYGDEPSLFMKGIYSMYEGQCN